MRGRNQRGSAIVEMALVCLPFFVLCFVSFEIARGMWMYHTLASSVKAGTRYAIVHGEDCVKADPGCVTTVADIVSVVRNSAVGLQPLQMQVTLTAGANNVNCAPVTVCVAYFAQWPPPPANGAGQNVTISARYSFNSVLAVLWPGHGTASVDYASKATESIQF